MTVIAVSIAPGSMDKSVLTTLARKLDLELVDNRSFEMDVAERAARDSLGLYPELARGTNLGTAFAISQQNLTARLREQLLEIAQRGSVLIASWGATAVFSSMPEIACIATRASTLIRERNISKWHAYDKPGTASLEIESQEASIARYVACMFDFDWRDPSQFDLIVNTSRIEGCHLVDVIAQFAVCRQFRETPAMRLRLKNFMRATHECEQAKANVPKCERRLF